MSLDNAQSVKHRTTPLESRFCPEFAVLLRKRMDQAECFLHAGDVARKEHRTFKGSRRGSRRPPLMSDMDREFYAALKEVFTRACSPVRNPP